MYTGKLRCLLPCPLLTPAPHTAPLTRNSSVHAGVTNLTDSPVRDPLKARNLMKKGKTRILNTCNNGVGDYVQQLKRLTFRIHPTDSSSFHAREFISRDLIEVATRYPGVSIYVTESQSRVPNVTAHYLNGYQEEQRIDNVHQEVLKQFVDKYCNYSGNIQKGVMLRQQHVSQTRSIQGQWNPYINAPQPDMNTPPSLQEVKDAHRVPLDYTKYRGTADKPSNTLIR